MSSPAASRPVVRRWQPADEHAHRAAVHAAGEGLADSALGSLRLAGDGVPVLAEAAVSSATPYLRAPLLGRIAAALDLHAPETGEPGGQCPVCRTAAPCPTTLALTS
ncbi:MAG: hypothetical protein M3P96_05005 [Actinomycetota bacterium]|nr:hypothetical protein [Actinomycetota bacterium]